MAAVMLRSLAVLLAAAGAAAVPITGTGCSPAPYSVLWNVAGDFEALIRPYGIASNHTVQTGGGCTLPGCKAWRQGLWPRLNAAGEVSQNGGVPQNANLTAHLEALAEQVVAWIPDPDWNGSGVFDFEDYTPIWEQNTGHTGSGWHDIKYQNYSEFLVRQEHPTWTNVTAAAKQAFEAAALTLFTETLKTVSKLRPKAKWGYYGLAEWASPLSKDQNDRMKPIWEASGALFPSIYLPPGSIPALNRLETELRVKEALRCAAGRIPVRPFFWSFYHDGKTTLSPKDAQMALSLPGELGCDAVVVWGAPAALKHLPEFTAYLKSELGPLCQNTTEAACACSQSRCSGNGRCVGSACSCYPGHTGPACAGH